ncbi:MAG: TonB-dependent receptor [Wenzhouxiangellaceae bacterium]|nr:TonB-dependent receptor [Wenzhouxiangellaceae bacterium]
MALATCLGAVPHAMAQEEPVAAENEESADPDRIRADREEEAARLDDVSVVGFRRSVEKSVATKRNNTSIVEAVYAEDIGKLPDVSIAESLARLPGLTSQRTDGRSQTISIRGLGPDFSTALLNGREQVTTGDNRGVEFDQYPAELLGSVVVFKTPDATLIGQGLAGTVDLRTIRPLAAGEQTIAANARYEFTDEDTLVPGGDDQGYRASVTYIDQFADDTFGVMFGAAIQSTPNQIRRFNAWGYPTNGDGNLVPGGAKPFSQANELERIGLIGTFEWAPAANFQSTLDWSYSDFEEEQLLSGIEFPLFWSSAQLAPPQTVVDGLVTEGRFDNVHPVMRNDVNQRDAELFTLGWNNRFQINGLWGVESDVSFSSAQREDSLVESYAGTGPAQTGNPVSVGFNIADNGVFQFDPDIDFTNPNLFVLTDPQGWGAGAQPNPLTQAGFINNPETDDWLAHARFHVDRQFITGPFSQAMLGVDFSRRDKDRTIRQTFLTPPNGATSAPIPQEALRDGTVDLGFIGIPGMINWDPRFLLENVYDQVDVQLSSFNVPQDWQVREDVVTTFFRLDVDTMIANIPVNGNVGLQWVYTDQSSTGFRVAGADTGAGTVEGGFVPTTRGDSYNKFLPSLNLSFDLGNDLIGRLGASRVMARARMDQLNAGLSLGTDFTQLTSTDPNQSFFSAGGGNPGLRPLIANTVDVSFEKYFADNAGYIALAGYYKNLEDFINPNDSFLADFSAFIPDFLTPEQAEDLGTPLGTVSGPTNNGDGDILGAEFTASVPLGPFIEPLEGFGLISSVSYTDSSVQLGDNPDDITIPGLSEWVINSTVYFERNGFQARVSHRYRDEFLSEVFGLSATRVQRSAKEESIIDAQIGYSFNTGPLENLTITLQGNNLTDEPFTTFESFDERLIIDRQIFGRNFLLGASYRF